MAILRLAVVVALLGCSSAAVADEHGSVVSYRPLGQGSVGMSISGGYAVALPFMAYAVEFGVTDEVDLGVRYETVGGLLHFPALGARWVPFKVGGWNLGGRLGVAYSFFGIQTEDLNLTSTLYLPFEIGASGAVGEESQLVVAVGGEVDLARFVVVEDEGDGRGEIRYDATTLRFGLVSALTADLDVFVQGRLRVPIETVTDGENEFFVVPYIEGGGSFAF
jgi:hypothetical protein